MGKFSLKDVIKIEEHMKANGLSKFTKLNDDKLLETTKNFYEKACDFDGEGNLSQAYKNYYLAVEFGTMSLKLIKDKRYVELMIGKEFKESVNRLEEMKNQCLKENREATAQEEALKEQAKVAELNAKQTRMPQKDARRPLTPLSGNHMKDNSNWESQDDKFIIKPDDKYTRHSSPPELLLISCENLKTEFEAKKSSILLIDCRPVEDFQACRISENLCGDNLINIPPEINTHGLSARTLGEKLSERTKTLWDVRSTFDMIVLFDQTSRLVPNGSPKSSLEILFSIIKLYDVNTKYKSPPYLLKGGFDGWFVHFPFLTTNASLYKKMQHERSLLLPNQTSWDSISYSYNFDSTPEPELPTEQKPLPPTNTEPSLYLAPSATQPAEANDVITEEPKAVEPSRTKPSIPHVDRTAKPVDNSKPPSSHSPILSRPYDSSAPRLNKTLTTTDTLESRIEHLNINNSKGDKMFRSYGSLNRSSSHPNLTQINGGDTLHEGRTSSNVPEFDRSKKPTQDRGSYDRREHSVAGSNVGPGLTGLKNLGNTCYINSILQCLSNTSPLRHYFTNEFDTFRTRTGVKLAEEFVLVFKKLWAGDIRYFPPNRFKDEVGKMKRTFRGYEQQDSHEFLTILIDSLHEELKEPAVNSVLTGASVESGEKSWGDFIAKNHSIVSSLFYGQLKSTVMCLNCEETSSTFEVFSNVSLPLPSHDYCSLRDCLDLYLKGEDIQGWHCPRCKTKRDARKKLDITKLPPILVLHFKRFTSDGWCRKKQTSVEFPVDTDLSMREYTTNPESRDVNYELYAVSNHYGTMESGHYTAYCKNKYKWYKFDDSDVTEISASKVKSSAAYILFYVSTRVEK